jgi:putative peptidoglycan lipid II flippase
LIDEARALAMGGLLWLTARLVWPFAADAHGLAQAAVLGILIAGGIAIYALLLTVLGVMNRADAVKALRRSGPRDLRP